MKKRSKLLDNPPEYGGPLWGAYQYERAKEANIGHNYRYWNDKWWKEMENKGWEIYRFNKDEDFTSVEAYAKQEVQKLRQTGNYSRIVCGYHQTRQHQKFFTVIYKKKQHGI